MISGLCLAVFCVWYTTDHALSTFCRGFKIYCHSCCQVWETKLTYVVSSSMSAKVPSYCYTIPMRPLSMNTRTLICCWLMMSSILYFYESRLTYLLQCGSARFKKCCKQRLLNWKKELENSENYIGSVPICTYLNISVRKKKEKETCKYKGSCSYSHADLFIGVG